MSEETQDRRRFYRIKDRVSLSYRVVQPADMEMELSRVSRKQRELSELRNAALAIDARLDAINRQLKQENPLLAEAMVLFQRKIAVHESMLGMNDVDEASFSPAREINLSANGVAFVAETKLYRDTCLKMELVLYPESHYISLFARVVQCNQIEDDSLSGFRIAVEFTAISDEDEERIVNHIFRLQAAELRRSKIEVEDSLELEDGRLEKTEENISAG